MAKEKATDENKTEAYRFVEYFKNHPAVAASLLYFMASVIAISYSWSFYRLFQINIFDYAETNDLLMAAFKGPFAFLVSIIIIVSMIVAMLFLHSYTGIRARIIYWLAFFFILAYLFTPSLIFSKINAKRLIKDKKSVVKVLFEERREALTSVTKELTLSLIGSTDKFMFFYDHSDSSTMVIPITKIINIKAQNKKPIKNEKKEENENGQDI